MANAGVIINADLKSDDLTKKIDKLVKDVDAKFSDMAQKIDDNVQLIKLSLEELGNSARTRVAEIKQAFTQLGTTFNQFAAAMQRAAAAASGMGGRGGSGGAGGSGGSGGTNQPTVSGTIAELKQQIEEQKKLIDAEKQHTAELQKKVNLLKQMEDSLRRQTTSTEKLRQQAVGMNLRNINSIVPTNTTEAENKLNRLKRLFENLKTSVRNLGVNKFDFLPESMWNRIQASIKKTERDLERLKKTATMPTKLDMNNVMGMSEKTLNEISTKMKAINELRLQTPVGSADISRLNAEYARLSKLQTEIIGKNATLVESNNALGRAFNYIKNRLAFMLTVGAFTGFVRQLYEIRGQYELLERSLGVLLNSFSKGSQIFNELNEMAIKSPFTLIELGTAAKQLTAYNFKANEVVDTTRRLADISSALGVPMERLVYNLGQIRAQTVLTARDARDFANAGLAIVPELAKHYTELEGKVVSTADVFDRMKKKAVSYNDVMSVLYKITDEGGKFFDFQAKQAGTLKVQLANLNLAWNNMLNDMGKANQGLLSWPVQGLRDMFLHWKDISTAIEIALKGLAAYKLAQFAITRLIGTTNTAMVFSAQAEARANVTRLRRIALTRQLTNEEQIELARNKLLMSSKKAMTQADYENVLAKVKLSKAQATQLVTTQKTNMALKEALVSTGTLTREELNNAAVTNAWSLALNRLTITIANVARTIKSMFFNIPTLIMSALAIGLEIKSTFNEASDAIEEFNKDLAASAKESNESLTKFLNDYQKTNDSLYKWRGQGTDRTQIGKQDIANDEAKKAWEAIKEEIIKSSSAGREFVSQLELIADVNERVRQGFKYIQEIQKVHGALQDVDKEAIKVQQDFSKWWNLWLANDSMEENIKDYVKSVKELEENWGGVSKALDDYNSKTNFKGGGYVENYIHDITQLRQNLSETAADMVRIFTEKGFSPEQEREAFNKVADEIVQKSNLSTEESLRFRMTLEEQYSAERLKLYKNELGENYRAAYGNWIETFETGQSLESQFLSWLGRNYRSEVQQMFGNMTEEEIKQINWSEPKWAEWANKNASEFAKQFGLSFNELQSLVIMANRWSVRIPVFFDFQNTEKTLLQTLTDADAKADAAQTAIDRLNRRIKDGITDIDERAKADKELADAEKALAEAEAQGGHSKKKDQADKKAQNAANKAAKARAREQKKSEDAVASALRSEISVIKEMQSAYDKLRKAGVGSTEALQFASSGYDKTLKSINATLSKYGISPFKAEDFVGSSDPHKLLTALQNQLDTLIKSGKVKTASLKDLEMEIQKITVDAKEYDMKKITDGLNNELGKIKEEYELAVELDANPELGDMFADMFGIDVDELPHTFGEAYDRANKVAIEKLKKLEKEVQGFDLMSTDLTKFAEKQGIKPDSNLIQELMKDQKTWRDIYKKNLLETEKFLDEYVKKYGNMSDKIAEIEADRLEKIKKLNNYYRTEQLKQMPEYIAKLDAINKGAEREKGAVRFDEFKNSRLYIAMFENLQYVSTATLTTLRQKLEELKSEMGSLSPEQLKQVVQQFEKIDDELRRRSPFKDLIKNYHDFIKANGKAGKQAEKDLVVAQENYDKQMQVVTALKEQLVQAEAKEQKDWMEIARLRVLIALENDKLKGLDEELQKAIELNEQYNLMKKAFGDQWQQIVKLAQTVSTNLKSLGELRDYLKDAGVDFGDAFDGVVDSLQGVSEGMNQIVSSATSGDVFGVVTGTIKTVFGIGDAIASIFGDGAARTRRINREIKKSQEEVRRLNMAYKDLERTVNKAMGSQEIAAQRALIANKKAELAEIERQLRLEKSKRSKDRDEDAIKQYEETIPGLKHEIEDLGDALVENLLGSNVKSAAEDFVETWVSAWKEGENTLDAIEGKMDDVVHNIIKKAVASKIVGTLLQPFYNTVDQFTSETSEGGVQLTLNELKQLSEMANTLGININDALSALFANFENLGIVDRNGANAQLSALQQGIQGITEDTAGALEAYMNGVSQQVYYQSDILTQIRDILINFGGDVTIATNAQILLQLQQSYAVQMTIQSILQGWSNASGLAMRVELVS